MKYLKILIFCFPVIFAGNFILAQNKADIQLVGSLFEINKSKPDYKYLTKGNSNELQWMATGLLLFYKTIFSSQDGNRCVFHPSCSIYALESIRKKGLILGYAAAIDRLTRCNKLNQGNYQKYENTNLLYDPVD
jgi:putative membrane protein insertion efficiency factor